MVHLWTTRDSPNGTSGRNRYPDRRLISRPEAGRSSSSLDSTDDSCSSLAIGGHATIQMYLEDGYQMELLVIVVTVAGFFLGRKIGLTEDDKPRDENIGSQTF